MTTRQELKCAHCFPLNRLEEIDGRLAVFFSDVDSHAHGVRYVKFWVDDAPSSPNESRSHAGGDAPSRASPHHVGTPPFPNLSARETSRTPATPERGHRPPLDQSGQDRSYGHGNPDFGGGVGFHDADIYTNSTRG